MIGIAVVVLLYVGLNLAYLRVLSPEEIGASPAVAADMARAVAPQMGSVRPDLGAGRSHSVKRYQTGHCWFSIRDELSQIRCVMWKTYATKMAGDPPDGTEVYLHARPTFWPDKGEVRLAVNVLLPSSGIRLQRLARERTREALEKDGLLDP